MWFNFQAHHLHEYAAMETQDRATQANQYNEQIHYWKTNYRETIDYREYCLSHYHDSKKALSLSTSYKYCHKLCMQDHLSGPHLTMK